MRKIQKIQMQNSIPYLNRIHEMVKTKLTEYKIEEARELLKQCQQYAIELGHMIEAEEKNSSAIITILEEYCEQVYQIYQKAEKFLKRREIDSLYKYFCDFFSRLKILIENIEERREVVFLPYKASMWDSLESIWKAANEDPGCDVYVIPIPYYDRKPDGSFGVMHYEGSLYPADVQITDYGVYDFAGHHPDIIFIHNPYDEYNYVTSVHPFFYAKNLKKYTEMLVYVPYFVLNETEPDDQKSVEEIEHFCILPGVLWADRVIVQSEAMRQIYIDVLERSVDARGRVDWREKILGLGSPKLDCFQNLEKDKWDVPEEWKKFLYKPDGRRKKVVFYNIGLKTLPQYQEKMLKKIQEVLYLFWKNREEIALLWRPHPLLKATLESMNSGLSEAYTRIVEQYKREKWGIYDDTADIDRAVMLCDAYYGDASSIVRLCRETGKIILIQNPETERGIQSSFLSEALIFENFYDDGNSFWFTSFDYNGLFQMNKKNCDPELIGIFPGEEFFQGRLYTSTVACNGKLYFAPFSAMEIAEYDPEKNVFSKISVDILCVTRDGTWESEKFFRAAVIEKKIYFIPYHYPGILCYDTERKTVICFDDWIEEIEKLRASEWGYFVEYEIWENKLILPCMCADAVVIFDTITELSQIMHMPKTDHLCKYCGICHIGELFYLVSADGTLRKRKLNEEDEEEHSICLQMSAPDEIAFYPVRCLGEWLYLFPFKGNKVVQVNIRTGAVITEAWYDDDKEKEEFSFLNSITDEGRLYAVAGNDRCFIEYNFADKSRHIKKLFLSEKDRIFLEKQKSTEDVRNLCRKYVIEDTDHSLEFLLEILKDYVAVKKSNSDAHVSKGRLIYRTLLLE